MKIFTLWVAGDDEDMPWLLDAVDEYTVENCGFPDSFLAHQRDYPDAREMIIDIPEDAVRKLFLAPTVKATVVEGS